MTRLLVIEDDADIVALYRRMFKDRGIEIAGAEPDGARGLEAAGQLGPDVILLDLSMPQADGLEVLVGLKKVAPDARVVVVSGFHPSHLEPITRELGAHAYVQKGTTPAELVAALEDAARAEPGAFRTLPPERQARLMERARELI